MAGINNSNEPSTAPQADRWYNLTLGSSLKDPHHSSKFCTLRYEFKPASIDKNQRGTLHKSKDNKVTVEFQNNQPGKPKVTFEGISEDYKENDAVLFFDGESFRLERLHRAVKRLRHNRMQGESTAAVAASAGLSDASSPPVGKGVKHQPMYKDAIHAMPVEVERIDIGDFKNTDTIQRQEKTVDYPASQAKPPNSSPDHKNEDDLEEQLDIMNADDDDDDNAAADRGTIDVKECDTGIDINIPIDIDDEIADVDVSDGEADKGRNAAEALRAQVNAEERKSRTSSSSGSSGSESSGSESGSGSGTGSGSGSSSSDSESSDGDSVSSI